VAEGTIINSLNKEEILIKKKLEGRSKRNMNACYPVEIIRYSYCYIYCDIHLAIICILFQGHRMHDRSRS